MSFLVKCPHCGRRSVNEFRFGGEYQRRPLADAPVEDWVHYLYLRSNEMGPQREWWYHQMGCRSWFLATRDLRNNEMTETALPGAGSE